MRFVVALHLTNVRLDQALAALSGLSRRRSRALADEGRVWLNQKPTRVLSRTVRYTDVIDIIGDEPGLKATPPDPASLTIIFEDGWLVAIDKPTGVASQPPRKRAPGEHTAQELLEYQLAWRDGMRREILLFHRLDRVTSGLLVFARQHDAARNLVRAWTVGQVRKTYLAIVCGDPGEQTRTIESNIAPDPQSPGRYCSNAEGKLARTELRKIAAAGEFALLAVRPFTGRTHQVRVHLAEAGFPVAGDRIYGGGRDVPRPFLHAWRLHLPHPKDGHAIQLEAPIPLDMQNFMTEHGVANFSSGKDLD